MPGKRVLTDGSKQTQKRGKKAKLKSDNIKEGEMDTETKSDSVTDKVSVSKVLDLEAVDGATEYLCPIEKEGDTVLEVECGPNKALMYLSKLYQGSKGSCLSFQGSWLTPNEFQYVSGRETAKDWKRSIRHQGKSIKLLFSKGILSVGGGGTSKNAKRPKKGGKRQLSARRGRRKLNVNLDSAGEENGESRETEVQCGEEQAVSGSFEGGKNNAELSKEQVNGEGDLSDANSDSTENYDVDFLDSVTETDKVSSESEEKSKNANPQSASTQGHFKNEMDVFSFESSEESDSCSKTDKSCDKKTADDVPEKTVPSECETKVNDVGDDGEENTKLGEKESGECLSDKEDDNAEEVEDTEQPTDEGSNSVHEEVEKNAELEISEEKKDDTVETLTEKEVTSDQEAKEEEIHEDHKIEDEEEEDDEQKVEEQKSSSKRPSPARESKLGSIIDQLRVNREKVTKERREHDLTNRKRDSPSDISKKTTDCPSDKKQGYPSDFTKDNGHDMLEPNNGMDDINKIRRESMPEFSKDNPGETTESCQEKREQDIDEAKLNKVMWQMPTPPIRNPLPTEMKIAKIIDEQRKDSRRQTPCTEERKVSKGHSLSTNLHQKRHPERSTSAPSEIMEFLNKKRGSSSSDRHSFPSAGILYPWMKKESEDINERTNKSRTSSPSARLTPADKVKKLSTREKKESSSEKDYNDYMRVLAAKQERNPFFLSPPVHDPYFSMWTPDLLFPPGLFNPYSMFLGPNSQRGEVPTTTSISSLCSMPPNSGLPGFMAPPRPPHMSYPILDSCVPHPSPKESPSLPHSCQSNSRKRGPAEADTACALDLSTKRTKLECSNNDYLASPLPRSSESVDNCKKKMVMNLPNEKSPEGDKSNIHKTHNSHRHKTKNNHSMWQEKDLKGSKLLCKCGADNPENIMNWSAEKVFDFVSKLEGCSSYAKTFLAHRIEGKLLPLLTTDALIRNLGMKVGPAIILSEAVTRHVQDMSRFFHPCSYCKLKTSQRLSV
ncbi:uncharacterized protein LOC132563163 [Ylistrum balloti]|uniref:uncharacterized protein LOC132563163 n=1 Tax=Ylistrum balloti TaxID=509963 RepID=UPI002905D81B|nr:uncharacterized protein LOC132563163 [Ylistrum balloti]XP_060083903.1 uncharacterized protein LOC132563163 [Ylistrum balloti]